jgi:hypothetical protein
MKNCGNKIKHTCSEKTYATCTYYEGKVPSYSSLVNNSCITLEETTDDTYGILSGIKAEIDLSTLGNRCFTYNPKDVKTVLLKFEREICDLKSRVDYLENLSICDKDITECVDLTGIQNQCNFPITTLGDLLTYLLNP